MQDRVHAILYWAAWILIGGGAMVLPYLDLFEPSTRFLLTTWRNGRVRDFTAGWRSVDEVWLNAPAGTDAAAVFRNFHSGRKEDAQFVLESCHRGAYTLYPRRLVAAYEGTIVSGGDSILKSQFDPDVSWFQDHKIPTIFYYLITEQDALQVTMATVPLNPSQNPSAPAPLPPQINPRALPQGGAR